MGNRRTTNLLAFSLVLFCRSSLLRATDVVTSQGKTYKNAEIIRVDTDSVLIKHSAGEDRIDFLQLPPSTLLSELQRQLAEREKLNAQLAAAQAEIRKLKQENEGFKQENTAVKQPGVQKRNISAGPPEETLPSPTPPLAGLPPIKKGEAVPIHDVVNHYQSDRAAADGRYRKQRFRVRGIVERIEKPMFVRKYAVFLKSFSPSVKVECNVQPPDDLAKIYVKDGETLMAARAGGEAVPLIKAGGEVTLEGWCSGFDNSRIVFNSCALVR